MVLVAGRAATVAVSKEADTAVEVHQTVRGVGEDEAVAASPAVTVEVSEAEAVEDGDSVVDKARVLRLRPEEASHKQPCLFLLPLSTRIPFSAVTDNGHCRTYSLAT